MSESQSGSEILIVDNSSENWKVLDYLKEWTEISTQFDIATGFFEIGALLALDDRWKHLEKIRILMGDEVTKRTRQTILDGVSQKLDESIESEKQTNDFLEGVPAITDAIKNGQVECRVYSRKKFHAKAYITHSKLKVVGSSALVGSSNFTEPGLSRNVELNVQLRREVEELQEWYERHWDKADPISEEILKIIERHTREYSPFEIYAVALKEFFRSYEVEVSEWEKRHSKLYPKLDVYQQEGYRSLMKISNKHRGAFLCDGVGLGKTFIGMMLIERFIEYERKRVALFVPKAANEGVWEPSLKKYLPSLFGRFSNLEIFNHTDLSRDKLNEDLESVKDRADVIIIDEAHHFRNPGFKGSADRRASRYHDMMEIVGDKKVFFLTATPVNNSLIDLQRMIELFTQKDNNYFRSIGIHSLPTHFRNLERELEGKVVHENKSQQIFDFSQNDAELVLGKDELFREIVVQRSRGYVRRSQELQESKYKAFFPERNQPRVAEYSIKKTYGKLLELLKKAFSKKEPLFTLAIYNPTDYLKQGVEKDTILANRQKQLVGLIRTLFLKRFESSTEAFRSSSNALFQKLLAFATKHAETAMEKSKLDRVKKRKEEQNGIFRQLQQKLFEDEGNEDDLDIPEDKIPEELMEHFEELDREIYDVEKILSATFDDMNQILDFLDEFREFTPAKDDKLQALIRLLKTDRVLKKHKVIIFTEYLQTAQYIFEELKNQNIDSVAEIDGGTKPRERGLIVKRFSPFYNGSSSAELEKNADQPIRVLISTDVLAEGLNLQDATRLINYDLHWNPVRLMQRIGRVDRRLNPEVEKEILKSHPEQKDVRGTIAYWNFLPPDELDSLLNLYSKVSNKVLKISRVFGIEGKKLLTPEDDYEALRNFTHDLDGDESPLETLHLEYQNLLKTFPDLEYRIEQFPNRIFSGKKLLSPKTKAVFFCYELPEMPTEEEQLGIEFGTGLFSSEFEYPTVSRWYLFDIKSEEILEDPIKINEIIRCDTDTPRVLSESRETLISIRKRIDESIKNGYMKRVQAPIGTKPILKAWLEIS